MEASLDLQRVSRCNEGSDDNDSSSATEPAAANSDVISRCAKEFPDVWERRSNNEDIESDVGDDDVTESGHQTQRQRQLAIVEDILQTAVDDANDVDDWERFFGARDELLRLLEAGVLDNVEQADEVERLSSVWMEVVEKHQRGRAVDRRAEAQQCDVCLERVKLDRRPCCGLAVCRACMTNYVQSRLETAGVVRVACPSTTCDRFLFHEEVRELLRWRPRLRERYDRWVVDANADPRRKTCPRCCRVTELETTEPGRRQRAAGGKYGVLVNCPDCRLSWCFTCQSPWHDGLTCARNRAGDELLKRWANQRTSRDEHNAQRCPRCKVYIQRISGCDHMKCTRCKTKFCYRCGGRRFKVKLFGYSVEDHDKKYSIIGCNDRFRDNQRLRRVISRAGIFSAKLVGGLVAVPVVCGAAGVALAAVTVAAPVYGVYRLLRHVLRSSSVLPAGDTDHDSDVDWEDSFDYSDIFVAEPIGVDWHRVRDETLHGPVQDSPPPPPLPPRVYYNYNHVAPRRLPPAVPLDYDVTSQRGVSRDHRTVPDAAPDMMSYPPPLPARQSIQRCTTTRRRPPAVPPPSPRPHDRTPPAVPSPSPVTTDPSSQP